MATGDDEAKLNRWLAEVAGPIEPPGKRLNESLLGRCRAVGIEPAGRLERIIAGAPAAAEAFCARPLARLREAVTTRLEARVDDDAADHRRGPRSPTGSPTRRVTSPACWRRSTSSSRSAPWAAPNLSAGVPDVMVAAWHARPAVQYPSDLQHRAGPLRLTLLASPCWSGTSQLTDGLVDLSWASCSTSTVGRERRVEREMLGDLKRV